MNLGKKLKRIFNPRPIETPISEVDEFLEKFDAEHPEEQYASQERKKFDDIAYRRDNVVKSDPKDKIWSKF